MELLRTKLLRLLELYYLGRYRGKTPRNATIELFTSFKIVYILINWFNFFNPAAVTMGIVPCDAPFI